MADDRPPISDFPKAYDPQLIEPKWARAWVDQQLFRADPLAPGRVFSIVIPPPNVTGSLHIGHMLDHSEIDILVRWHRMRGDNTLYLPGTDHAGISTQRVVVRQLAAQGIDYRALGREEFERRVWKWKEESGGTITRQMVDLGESCDWSREKFTLSPELSRVVIEVFVRLYEEGLIYRGRYIVNWCPQCRTAISDLETVHQERQGNLWEIRYPVAGSTESVVVATTRPETMLGDTAVAVHPDDERYRHLVGKKVVLAAADESRDSDHRGYLRGPRIRHRRCEGHSGTRSQRLRNGPPSRSAADRRDDRRREDERRGWAICGHGPLRGAQPDR